jgi:hypothetical protein
MAGKPTLNTQVHKESDIFTRPYLRNIWVNQTELHHILKYAMQEIGWYYKA